MMSLAGAFSGFASHAGTNPSTQANPPTSVASHSATPVSVSDVTPPVPNDNSTVPSILETVMPNDITVFGDQSAYNRLSTVADAYPEIWRDTGEGTVNVPEEQWMPIPTLPDAKPDANKVYPLSPEDKQVIDKEFDRLHQEGKLS